MVDTFGLEQNAVEWENEYEMVEITADISKQDSDYSWYLRIEGDENEELYREPVGNPFTMINGKIHQDDIGTLLEGRKKTKERAKEIQNLLDDYLFDLDINTRSFDHQEDIV